MKTSFGARRRVPPFAGHRRPFDRDAAQGPEGSSLSPGKLLPLIALRGAAPATLHGEYVQCGCGDLRLSGIRLLLGVHPR
jgi:hypothetical protein